MRLRFFFDAGAGVCLWSQDQAAQDRLGYAVDLLDLDLPAELKAEIETLMADYDATIDWSNPGRGAERDSGATRFGFEEDAPFRDRVVAMLPRLRVALGPGFVIESDYED